MFEATSSEGSHRSRMNASSVISESMRRSNSDAAASRSLASCLVPFMVVSRCVGAPVSGSVPVFAITLHLFVPMF